MILEQREKVENTNEKAEEVIAINEQAFNQIKSAAKHKSGLNKAAAALGGGGGGAVVGGVIGGLCGGPIGLGIGLIVGAGFGAGAGGTVGKVVNDKIDKQNEQMVYEGLTQSSKICTSEKHLGDVLFCENRGCYVHICYLCK